MHYTVYQSQQHMSKGLDVDQGHATCLTCGKKAGRQPKYTAQHFSEKASDTFRPTIVLNASNLEVFGCRKIQALFKDILNEQATSQKWWIDPCSQCTFDHQKFLIFSQWRSITQQCLLMSPWNLAFSKDGLLLVHLSFMYHDHLCNVDCYANTPRAWPCPDTYYPSTKATVKVTITMRVPQRSPSLKTVTR